MLGRKSEENIQVTIILAVVVILLLITIATVSAGASGQTEVSLSPINTSVGVGDTTTFDVVVENTDGGVGAYSTTISVEKASVAEITDIQLAGDPGVEDVTFADDNASVAVDARLMDTADTGVVTIATVTVRGKTGGATGIDLSVSSLGDEGGGDYALVGTNDATLITKNVASGPPGIPINPIADAGSYQVVRESNPVTLDGTGSSRSLENDSLSYSWTQTGGQSVSLSETDTAMPRFTAPEVDTTETLTFELTVSDENGGSDTDSVDISINPKESNTPIDSPGGTPTITPTDGTPARTTTQPGNPFDPPGGTPTITPTDGMPARTTTQPGFSPTTRSTDNEPVQTADTETPVEAITTPGGSTQDDMGIIPVALGASFVGLGGAGALWYLRSDEHDEDGRPASSDSSDTASGSASTVETGSSMTTDGSTAKEATPTTGESSPMDSQSTNDSQPDPDASADSDVLALVKETLNRGDNLRERAIELRDAGEYNSTLEAYDDAHEAYEEALAAASRSALIDTDEIKQKLDTVEEERLETRRQQLEDEVASLRSDLNRAGGLIDDDAFEKARDRLSDLDSQIMSVRESAASDGFEDLSKEAADLQGRHETLLTKTAQQERRAALVDDIETAQSELDCAEMLAEDNELEEAQERLEALESHLEKAEESATDDGFTNLAEKIAIIKQHREERLDEVIERIQAHPVPQKIPSVPDISIEYSALTDRDPIGGGGNADVTKATYSTLDGDVTLAIKEPRMAGTLHTDAVKRMLNEAETWDKLDEHEHIVGVVDYGSEPIPWIAMEYMDGGHLGTWVGEMEMPQALWTAIGVTKAVRHAHRRGVAHLDLKPENVLFRGVEDAWDVPKVADWGLSKHLLEHSKSVEGLSPQYAAPEQFDDGYGTTDDITDVYQLGAVFYELFTGQPPFEGAPAKAMRQVLQEPPTPPSEVADVPEALNDVLLTALSKRKSDRYDSVVYIRDELQELYADD